MEKFIVGTLYGTFPSRYDGLDLLLLLNPLAAVPFLSERIFIERITETASWDIKNSIPVPWFWNRGFPSISIKVHNTEEQLIRLIPGIFLHSCVLYWIPSFSHIMGWTWTSCVHGSSAGLTQLVRNTNDRGIPAFSE